MDQSLTKLNWIVQCIEDIKLNFKAELIKILSSFTLNQITTRDVKEVARRDKPVQTDHAALRRILASFRSVF